MEGSTCANGDAGLQRFLYRGGGSAQHCALGAIGCGHKVFNGIFATYLYLRYVQYNSNNFIQTKKKRPLLGAAFAKKIFFNTFKLDSEFFSARFIPGRRRPAPEEEEEDPSH